MTALLVSWQFWAILSAVFAAMTAIFAKIGVSGIDSDLATWLRTLAIAAILGAMVWAGGKLRGITDISPRAALFLLLSALATGASWLCYFRALSLGDAARVAPIDKLSVVMVAIFAALFLGEHLPPLGWAGVGLIAAGAILVAVAR
ncbi:EamA family transporter [Paenirhodobacter enshiensis]|uniref:Transporter n=1 Tax=Paenirhodobacter enshiensis TaxID=1105367 RepID=A0A086XZV6_9RHOB|nr:EamA family transporter [Paenirhodobacter enshiensis]KFI27556.1 transporter [Paenirhodobacter enshiensis]